MAALDPTGGQGHPDIPAHTLAGGAGGHGGKAQKQLTDGPY